MTERCFLGVDLGAESGRVMAGLYDGAAIRLQELHRFRNGGVSINGSLRWNVLGLWDEIQTGLGKAAEKYGDGIVSVGVDTWGVDYVLLSKGDELLGLPHTYRDDRTNGMLTQALSRVPREEIFAATGLQFMEINTLYQLLAMKHAQPELLDQADLFLMMPDFFHWCLSGSRVVEFTNATTTQCYHASEGNWAFDLLNKFELPTDMFRDVVHPGTPLGKLRESVSRTTGLPRIEVVAPSTHDTGSAVAAVPTQHTGAMNWAYISSGTWSLIGIESPQAILTDRALARNVTNEGGIDGTYRVLKNVMGLWLVQQCRASLERQGRSIDYAELTHLAEQSVPVRSLIDPDDARFLNPQDMPTAIRDFCGETSQPIPESPGELIRCCLDSLALKYRMVLEWLEELSGTKIEAIHVVGGGSQNAMLNQLTADACDVAVIAGPVEATIMGNLLIQARASGDVESLEDIRGVVRNSASVQQFAPGRRAPIDEAWERFRSLVGVKG